VLIATVIPPSLAGSRHNAVYLRRKSVSDRSLALRDKPQLGDTNLQIVNILSNRLPVRSRHNAVYLRASASPTLVGSRHAAMSLS